MNRHLTYDPGEALGPPIRKTDDEKPEPPWVPSRTPGYLTREVNGRTETRPAEHADVGWNTPPKPRTT